VTNQPIGPNEEHGDLAEQLAEVFDLAEQAVAATVSDEQLEARLAKLLAQDAESLLPHIEIDPVLGLDGYVDLVITTLNGDEIHFDLKSGRAWNEIHFDQKNSRAWNMMYCGTALLDALRDYVDEQLDRANEIKANAQAESTQIVDDARSEAARIIEDAKRLARLENIVSTDDDTDTCDTPIFHAMLDWCRFTEHQATEHCRRRRPAASPLNLTDRKPASIL
jgi:cell division septum initiation protein DivIVA